MEQVRAPLEGAMLAGLDRKQQLNPGGPVASEQEFHFHYERG
jgi:hypothetical protein